MFCQERNLANEIYRFSQEIKGQLVRYIGLAKKCKFSQEEIKVLPR
jgi:hypothetical protein